MSPTPTPVPAVNYPDTPREAVEWVQSGWQRFLDAAPTILTKLLTAAVLILLGLLVLFVGRRLIKRIAGRMEKGGSRPKKETLPAKTIQSLLLSVFNYIMYFIIALTVLSLMGVDVSSLLAVAGVGGVAISFGCQTLVKDVVSGLFLWVDGHIKVGDVVTVAGQTGTVESMSMRTTVLRSANGTLYSVPNGDIRTVVNMTADFRCAQADVTVNHGRDPGQMLPILQNEMEKLKEKLSLKETPEVLGIIAMDRFGATIRIQCPCAPEEVWGLEREIRQAALSRLIREGIVG